MAIMGSEAGKVEGIDLGWCGRVRIVFRLGLRLARQG